MHTRLGVAVIVLVGAWTLAEGQAAESASAQTRKGVDEERLLLESVAEARAQIGLGNLTQAMAILQRTYKQVPTPALLWPIADLHLRLQQPSQGLEALDRYVRQVPINRMPPGQQLADVERMRQQLREQLGRINVLGARPDSMVFLDGIEVARTPLLEPLKIDPGRHRLEVRSVQSSEHEIQVASGQTLQLDLLPESAQISETGRAGRAGPHRPNLAQFLVGGLGLASVAAGGVLWGLDGYRSCAQAPICPQELDGKSAGIALVSLGLGLVGTTVIWWIVDERKNNRERKR